MDGARCYAYTDGAARGNPGPAACAFIIVDAWGVLFANEARVLGCKTNNEAEYHAVIDALKKAASLSFRQIVVHSDSELVIRQIKGEYKVRKQHLRELFLQEQELESLFESVEFMNLPREDPWIRIVDRLCNEALDSGKT